MFVKCCVLACYLFLGNGEKVCKVLKVFFGDVLNLLKKYNCGQNPAGTAGA